MEEAVLKLRSSLKDKLVQLGLKPEGVTAYCFTYFILFCTQISFIFARDLVVLELRKASENL